MIPTRRLRRKARPFDRVLLLADGPPDGHFGKYFQVEFAGDPTPVWIHEDCVHGRCCKDASYHPELWYSYSKDR